MQHRTGPRDDVTGRDRGAGHGDRAGHEAPVRRREFRGQLQRAAGAEEVGGADRGAGARIRLGSAGPSVFHRDAGAGRQGRVLDRADVVEPAGKSTYLPPPQGDDPGAGEIRGAVIAGG